MSEGKRSFHWFRDSTVPAGAGFIVGGLSWAVAPRGYFGLGWHTALGGAVGGLACGLVVRRFVPRFSASGPLGCTLVAGSAIVWAVASKLVLEHCGVIPLPDWIVAMLVGLGIALVTVPAWQMSLGNGEAGAPWRMALYAAGAAICVLILFPVLVGHRHGSRAFTCHVNLAQLALAASMYAEDYDGQLPPPGPFVDSVGVDPTKPVCDSYGGGWLMPYLRWSGFWMCPSDPEPWDRINRLRDEFVFTQGTSYQWDAGLGGVVLDDVPAPNEAPFIFDRDAFHNEGRNVAFADGHVKWISEGEFGKLEVDAR